MEKNQKILISHFIMIFITCLIVFSLFAVLLDKLNAFLLALLLSFVVLVIIFLFLGVRKEKGVPIFKGKTALRYTMLCHRCNWEWMSNTSDKKPAKCPNCGENAKLEMVGWRKVNVVPKKSNKDLMSYLKR